MLNWLKTLFRKEKPVEVFVDFCKTYERIEHPLQYVKLHGDQAEYSKAKKLARQGRGEELRKLARHVQRRVEA